MTRKNKAIEILPRAMWIFIAVCLYLGQHIANSPPRWNTNPFLLCVGIILAICGFLGWMIVGYYMRRALFNKELVTAGPFKYARHPMYSSLYIMLFGVGIVFFSWVWFAIMAVFIPIFYLVSKIEERQMIELHGEKYLEYKRQVGMFMPKIRKFRLRTKH